MLWTALPDAVVAAALSAWRAGQLDALLRQRPRATRALARRLLAPLRRVAGDALADDPLAPLPWQLLVRAVLAELRPDGQPGLDAVPEAAWSTGTGPGPSWRPLLALASQLGLLGVPALPGLYHARTDEPPADQLCGLWQVGPSTFYRTVDRGRRQLAAALARPLADATAVLRRQLLLQHELQAWLGLDTLDARADWHRAQAAAALARHDGAAALWHQLHAGDGPGAITTLQRHAVALAGRPETAALAQRLAGWPLAAADRVALALAQAALARVRADTAAERQACELALRLASQADDPLLLGRAYAALGRHHETRDPDQAHVCLQDSADHLRRAGLTDHPGQAEPALLDEYASTLVQLAWWHLLRNDPRARALLDQAQALHDHSPRALPAQALLAQTWGEYWRRSADLPRALECKYRALHLYQRLGDTPGILKTYGNLSLLHGEARQFALAIDCSQQVLDLARHGGVEPETLAATHLNLGAACFWQSRWDAAIGHYRQALAIAGPARLSLLVGRAHYNLAEAHYKRFQALGQDEDEQRGDAHTAAALAVWPAAGDAGASAATRQLKQEILGSPDDSAVDRLLPAELAVHFDEMRQVQRQRAALALPLAPADQAQAHLAIAEAYQAMAVKEREAAQALIERHGLGPQFAAALGALRQGMLRDLGREQQLAALWQAQAADLLDERARSAVLQHLLREGAISKRHYAPLCALGLASASRHLGLLAERGLLQQAGRGPSTRYQLPD